MKKRIYFLRRKGGHEKRKRPRSKTVQIIFCVTCGKSFCNQKIKKTKKYKTIRKKVNYFECPFCREKR